MDWAWIVWLALMVFFLVVEAASVSLVSIWFAAGSLGALVASALTTPLWVQILVFLVLSGALLACLRPFVRKYVSPRRTATNVDMVLGREAYLTETVDNLRGTGALKLDGKNWSVRSVSGEVLPQDTLVTIVRMEGVKLYVEPAQTPVS